jgi:hypothetical protein
MSDGIAITGGSLTARRAAETLRRKGHTEAARPVCGETRLPHAPLSQGVLEQEALRR